MLVDFDSRSLTYQTESLVSSRDDAFTICHMLVWISVSLLLLFGVRRIQVVGVSPEMLGRRHSIIDPGRASNKVLHCCTGQLGHLRDDLDP